jgi:hypothetical protein
MVSMVHGGEGGEGYFKEPLKGLCHQFSPDKKWYVWIDYSRLRHKA